MYEPRGQKNMVKIIALAFPLSGKLKNLVNSRGKQKEFTKKM